MRTFFSVLVGGAALALCSGGRAQQLDNPTTVPVTIHGEAILINNQQGEFHIAQGGQLPGLPTEGVWAQAQSTGGVHFYSNVYTANLVPGVNYVVTVNSTACAAVFAHVRAQNAVVLLAPPGNAMAQMDSICLGSNFTFVLRIELINDVSSSLAGQRGGACSSFVEDKAIWYVGLGSLRNGRYAGAVGFRRSSIVSALYTRAALSCDPIDSSEVSVSRDTNGITQVQSGAVLLKMTTVNSTKYTIDCYLPETPTTVFATYTVSQYSGPGGGIRIDKLEDGINWSTVQQYDAGSLTWTVYDWRVTAAGGNLDTSNPIVAVVSGSTSTVTYGSGTGTNIKKQQKTYAGGELSARTWGPGETSAPSSSYSYYANNAGSGWAGSVATEVEPTGKWAKYEYYSDPKLFWAGEVNKIYRPWLGGPSTPASDANGYVESYTYLTNADSSASLPSTRTITIQGVVAGKTTWEYDWSVSANGHNFDKVTRREFSSASNSLATITVSYRENDANTFFRGRTHAVTQPDGTKDAYAYFNGTWNAASNAFSAYSAGGARQILTFHGQSTAGTGTLALTSWTAGSESWTLDTVHMVPNLSTVSETIVDVHGRIVRNTEYVFVNSSTIEPLTQIVHLFDSHGLPQKDRDTIKSISASEVATTYSYSAGLLTSKTDRDGTVTTWGYDNWLRNTTLTSAATSTDYSYPAKTQVFTYYPSGLKKTAQECSCSSVTTTYTYDTAGRLLTTKEPKPTASGGTLDTAYAYPGVRQTSVTLPTGATKITDLFLDGRVADEIGTAQIPTYYAYALETGGSGNIVRTIKRDAAGQTHGWLEETLDWLGRTIKQRSPQVGWTSTSQAVRKTFSYDPATGQPTSYTTVDDGTGAALLPAHRYTYGNLGLLASEGEDVDGGGLVNSGASRDRITYSFYAYAKASSSWSFTKTTQVLASFGSTTLTTVSSLQTKQTGFSTAGLPTGSVVLADVTSTDASNRVTRTRDYVNPSIRTRSRLTTIDGASQNGLAVWKDGYLQSELSVSGMIKTYSYHSDGQLAAVTEGTGRPSITYEYYPGTKYRSSESRSTDTSTGYATTLYTYTWNTTDKSSTVRTTFSGRQTYIESNALGLAVRTWGDGAQPTLIAYDGYGRRTGLTTWRSGTFTGSTWPASPPAGDAISFTNDDATGALTRKTYPDANHVDFTYNPRGQMKTRTWADGRVTTYKYFGDAGVTGDATGELQMADYPSGTTDVTYSYTRVGALYQVTDAAGTRTLAYDANLRPDTETLGTFYGSKVLRSTYATYGRPSGWEFKNGATVLASAAVGYDGATSRPNSVSGALGATSVAFILTYDPSGTLDWVSGVTSGSFQRSTPLRAGFDAINSATTTWSGAARGAFTAGYEATTGRRSGQTSTTSTYTTQLGVTPATVAYAYDAVGRLNSSGTLSGHTLGWNYDLAGNRTVSGETDTSATATSYTADSRGGYTAITGGRAEPGISYNADGNLTQDGTWTYSYDAENRLIQMTKSGQTLTFQYDYLGRRIRKIVTGTDAKDIKFLWAGWTLAAELEAATGYAVNRTFVWGPDFSDARSDAGGAGALLGQIDTTAGVSCAITDTFGTAVGYLGSTGNLALGVEYTPYGKLIRVAPSSAPPLARYPIGYHGKYMDWETGLAYYGLRYYQPKHGRFINRDPIGEAGGNNLFAFVGNAPVNGWDVLGLDVYQLPVFTVTETRLHGTDPLALVRRGSPATTSSWFFFTWSSTSYSTPPPQQATNGAWTKPAPRPQKAPNKTDPKKPKVENDCTRAYDAIVTNTPALPTGGRLDQALQSSGLDVETQLSQAWRESSFNPSASAAPRSSALGMFQFLTGTARDVETRVWPNFVSRTTPFAPGVTGDWRLDPGVSAQANYVYLLDRVAASGGSLAGGLGLYYGSRSAAANQNYANDILAGRSVLQDFADKHGGNLREALEQDCAKIKGALSK